MSGRSRISPQTIPELEHDALAAQTAVMTPEPLSAVALKALPEVGKELGNRAVADAVQGREVFEDGASLKLIGVPMVDALGLRIDALVDNPILREHYAGFFGGLTDGMASVTEHAHAIGVRISTSLGHFDVSLKDDSILGHLHLNEAIAKSYEPSIRAFEQLRLAELNRPAAVNKFTSTVEKVTSFVDQHLPFGAFAIGIPIGSLKHLAEFEQGCLRLLDEHGILVTAKRVDYLFGSQYVEGTAVNFPLVGGLANVISKAELGVGVTPEDWVKLGSDAFLIACITLAPVGGSVAAIVASGAVIGGVHSGLTQGALTYVHTGDATQALHAAGKASFEGATIGAVGGAVAGKAMQSLGNSLHGVLASGSLAGGAVGATDATFRILHDGASVSGAVSDILTSAGKGALTGGAFGGVHYGISQIAGRVATVAESSTQLRREAVDRFLAVEKVPEARLEAALQHAKHGEYFSSQNPGHIAKFESYVRELGPLPGVEENLLKIGGENRDLGRGHYTELARAVHLKRAGQEVLAINQRVDVPGVGKTDIDILCRGKNGGLEWHENKHVRTISCDADFCAKIDKMAAAKEHGFMLDVGGHAEPVQRVVFTNSGHISDPAIEYARNKGVEIYDHRPYTRSV